MDEITVSVDFMKSGVKMAFYLVIIGGVMNTIRNNKLIEFFFALFKVLFYGALAFFLMKFVEVKGLIEIDSITAFTCIFCALECGDNLYKIICMLIQLIKDFISVLKKK